MASSISPNLFVVGPYSSFSHFLNQVAGPVGMFAPPLMSSWLDCAKRWRKMIMTFLNVVNQGPNSIVDSPSLTKVSTNCEGRNLYRGASAGRSEASQVQRSAARSLKVLIARSSVFIDDRSNLVAESQEPAAVLQVASKSEDSRTVCEAESPKISADFRVLRSATYHTSHIVLWFR
jgi:hypothetical protein